MWILVFFDLPTETKKDIKEYTIFRKFLLDDGFTMFQFSIYIRNCASSENAAVHIKRIKSRLPPHGKVGILCITDKQFSNMELFFGTKTQKVQAEGVQLELLIKNKKEVEPRKAFTISHSTSSMTNFFFFYLSL